MTYNDINYREIQRGDYPALESIVRKTWGYDKFCSPRIARKMSRLYLAACLASQTFIRVAELHGTPVGVIMAKNEKTYRTPPRYAARMAAAMASIYLTAEGRRVARFFQDIDKLDRELLKESATAFDGELAFFAVAEAARGSGIGRGLFTRAVDYLRGEKLRNFYLFTDSTCNYGFYEHCGMRRLCERDVCLNPARPEKMRFFLYGHNL